MPQAAAKKAPLLTVRDVAQELTIGEQCVRDLLHRGKLRGLQIGRRWRVSPEHLQAYRDAQELAAAPSPAMARATGTSRWGNLEPIDNPFK